MSEIPRIALYADTFHELNGAANFLRRLVDFAQKNDYPFLCLRSGEQTGLTKDGSVRFLDLERCRFSIPLDGSLKYDPFLWKKRKLIKKSVEEFAPDVIHITGLNDISQFGYIHAHFMNIPAVATWHTNTHEYVSRRFLNLLPRLPENFGQKIGRAIERTTMFGLMKLCFLAQMHLAPNEELVEEIRRLTRRPSFLLGRGVDTDFLSPEKRRRGDGQFVLGFVGRLRPEKNVRIFIELEQALRQAGVENYKFLIVGGGSEKSRLEESLQKAEFTGEIHGEQLARAFADMDLFVFPSQTDAFGNVVLEAMAAGVPAVVMSQGGPKFLIEDNVNGFVADGKKEFVRTAVEIVKNPGKLCRMRKQARRFAEENSWEKVFRKMYEYYRTGAKIDKKIRA